MIVGVHAFCRGGKCVGLRPCALSIVGGWWVVSAQADFPAGRSWKHHIVNPDDSRGLLDGQPILLHWSVS